MKNYIEVEVILFSKYFKGSAQQKLVKWLRTTVQPVIDCQERQVKKMFPRTLKDTPPIYLS